MVDVARPPAYARFGGSHYIRNKRKKQQDLKAFDSLIQEPVDLGVVAIDEFSDSFAMPSNGQLAIRAISELPAQAVLLQKNNLDFFTHPELDAGDFFKGKYAYVNEQIRATAFGEITEGEFEICVVDLNGVLQAIAHGEISGTGVKITSAALTGTGAITAAPVLEMVSGVQMAGAGSIATSTELIPADSGEVFESSATLTGTGAMTAQTEMTLLSSTTLAGQGSILTSTELIPAEGGATFETSATLIGTGSLSAQPNMLLNSGAQLAGVGTLIAEPEIDQPLIMSTAISGVPNDNSIVDVTMPSGLTAGEMIVVYATNAAGQTIDTDVSGSNWITKETRVDSSIRMSCYYKIAEGGDALRILGSSNNGMSCIAYRVKGATDILNASSTTAAGGKPNCPALTAPAYFPDYDYLWLANIGCIESDGGVNGITDAPANMEDLLKSFAGSSSPQSGANRAMAGAKLNLKAYTFDPDEFPRAANISGQRTGFTSAIYKAKPSPIIRLGADSVAGNGSTLTLPSHQAGDILVAWAFRAGSSVAPSLASGWTNINTAAGTSGTIACRAAYLVAVDGATAPPSFTNAGFVAVLVYRNARLLPSNHAISAAGSGSDIPYPALINMNPDLTSWMIAFAGHRSSNGDLAGNPPDGFGMRTNVVGTGQIAAFDTNGGNRAFAAETVSIGGTSNNRARCVIELVADWTNI